MSRCAKGRGIELTDARDQLGRASCPNRAAGHGNAVIPKADVVYRPVGDGGVLLSGTHETYYGLNAVGALIWERLASCDESLDAICAVVETKHPDTDPNTIRQDVVELLDDLEAHGLVSFGTDRKGGATDG